MLMVVMAMTRSMVEMVLLTHRWRWRWCGRYHGWFGSDTIDGGFGSDVIDGGDGADVAFFCGTSE